MSRVFLGFTQLIEGSYPARCLKSTSTAVIRSPEPQVRGTIRRCLLTLLIVTLKIQPLARDPSHDRQPRIRLARHDRFSP
jgi:hypothetical protein